MLTINATLAAAMLAGTGEPIAKLIHNYSSNSDTSIISKYTLRKDGATIYVRNEDLNFFRYI
jgi:hypothetical protein